MPDYAELAGCVMGQPFSGSFKSLDGRFHCLAQGKASKASPHFLHAIGESMSAFWALMVSSRALLNRDICNHALASSSSWQR